MSPSILIVAIAMAFVAGVALGRRPRATAVRLETLKHGFNFTEDVRTTLSRSREEARLIGNEYVGPEHILLALAHINAGVAARVLERLRIAPATLRAPILGILKTGTPHASPDLPYTSRAKRVLENSMSAARDLGHDYVGTEHLLLGLARDTGSVGKVLADAGADYDTLRSETLAALQP